MTATGAEGAELRSSVQPSLLLRQLDELWAGFSKSGDETTEGAVVRACSLTWITVLEGDDHTVSEVDEMLAGVMRDHPSRAVVILLRDGETRSVKGSVSAQCWRPFGSKQQICVERILLETTRAGACDVPAVVRALLVADLPVVMVCRNADLLQLGGIRETSQLADRVVVDIAYQNTVCAKLWPQLPGLGRFVSDLSWDRVIGFRRGIAKHFATAGHRAFLKEFTRLSVSTRPGRPSPEAAYLLSWVLNSLGFARHDSGWRCGEQVVEAGFTKDGASHEAVSAVEFHSAGHTLRFVTAAMNGNGPGRQVISVGEAPGDTELLSDEMVVEYRRRTFEQFLPETVRLFEEPHYFAHE